MSRKTLPSRCSTRQLAELWDLTPARVNQFARGGQIQRGEDGKFDTREALTFRAARIAQFRDQAFEQRYGNRFASGEKAAPAKVLSRVTSAKKAPDPLALDEDEDPLALDADDDPLALDLEDEFEFVAPEKVVNAMDSVVAQSNELVSLRAQKLRIDLARAENKARHEAGELIDRKSVEKTGHDLGRMVANILRNIPSEIAALFQDPDIRAETRAKMQQRIDQIMHALHKAASEASSKDE